VENITIFFRNIIPICNENVGFLTLLLTLFTVLFLGINSVHTQNQLNLLKKEYSADLFYQTRCFEFDLNKEKIMFPDGEKQLKLLNSGKYRSKNVDISMIFMKDGKWVLEYENCEFISSFDHKEHVFLFNFNSLNFLLVENLIDVRKEYSDLLKKKRKVPTTYKRRVFFLITKYKDIFEKEIELIHECSVSYKMIGSKVFLKFKPVDGTYFDKEVLKRNPDTNFK
jgi:hypothetical protein